MKYLIALSLLCVTIIGPVQGQSDQSEFVNLIDADLSNWLNPYEWGEADVNDGVVTLLGDEKWFLVSKETYGDFILEADVKVPVQGNSGLQFRAHYEPNRLWGYQAEVDPSDRSWAGGLYDEGRRGWLNPLDGENEAAAREAFKNGEWNSYRIKADGPHIEIWVNGIQTTDYYDTADMVGHIALQHHGEDGLEYQFRNVRIQDLGRHEWTPLFDGASFDGWHTTPGGEWTIEDSVIVGTQDASDERHGLLITDAEYDDFALRLKFKAIEGNSGLYFRAEEVDDAVHVHGFQAEIEPNGETGGLYETGGREWVVMPDSNEVKTWLNEPGEWNEMSVVAQGPRIVVHVNGHRSADIHDTDGRTRGPIGLQLHGGMDMDVRFRDVEMLSRTSDSPPDPSSPREEPDSRP